MSTLTSSQLSTILSTNQKSIEIYMETQAEYEEIIRLLEGIREDQKNHKSDDKEHKKEQIEKLEDIIKSLEEKLVTKNDALILKNAEVLDNSKKIEQTVRTQNKILIGAFVVIILGIVAKIFGLPLPTLP